MDFKGELNIETGLGLPQYTTTERVAYIPAQAGYVIFDTSLALTFIWDGTDWVSLGGTGGAGVTIHGALSGLYNDDHPQYLNEARADTRYSNLQHIHNASEITGGTLADARISESSITQHETALTITQSQIAGFVGYLPLTGGTLTNNLTIAPTNGSSALLLNSSNGTATRINFTVGASSVGDVLSDINNVTLRYTGVSTTSLVLEAGHITANSEIRGVMGTDESSLTTKAYVNSLLTGNFVNFTDTQSIGGNKTFTNNIKISATPTASTDAITVGYGNSNYIRVAGGTMVGDLMLNGVPSAINMAATKGYVDDKFTGFGNDYVGVTTTQVISGIKSFNQNITILGSPSSNTDAATVGYTSSNYLSKAGGTLTGNLVLNSAPTSDLMAATKKYVDDHGGISSHNDLSDLSSDDHPQYLNETRGDARYATTSHVHDYLPLSGGTLTGNVILSNTGAADITLNSTSTSASLRLQQNGVETGSFTNNGGDVLLQKVVTGGNTSLKLGNNLITANKSIIGVDGTDALSLATKGYIDDNFWKNNGSLTLNPSSSPTISFEENGSNVGSLFGHANYVQLTHGTGYIRVHDDSVTMNGELFVDEQITINSDTSDANVEFSSNATVESGIYNIAGTHLLHQWKHSASGTNTDLTLSDSLIEANKNITVNTTVDPKFILKVGSDTLGTMVGYGDRLQIIRGTGKLDIYNDGGSVFSGEVRGKNSVTEHANSFVTRGSFGSMAWMTYWSGTQAEYDAISSPDSSTIYFVTDGV